MFRIVNKGEPRRISFEGGAKRIGRRERIETDNEELVKSARLYPLLEVMNLDEISEEESVDEIDEGDMALSDMKVKELKAIAKDMGIKISGLKKADLIEAIEEV